MNRKIGNRYTKSFNEAVLTRMIAPNNDAIKGISKELGVSELTLYDW